MTMTMHKGLLIVACVAFAIDALFVPNNPPPSDGKPRFYPRISLTPFGLACMALAFLV